MDFMAIDVETANADQSSICQVGLAEVSGSVIGNQTSFLVDPGVEFDPFNIAIHGITQDMVAGQMSLKQALDHLMPIMSGNLMISHTPYDRVAIQRACALYDMDAPDCVWLDSARISRRAWPEDFAKTGYGLKSVAGHLGIALDHHDAGSDAHAAAEIVLRAIAHTGISLNDWLVRVERPIAELPNITKMEPDPNGPYFKESIAFTGSLQIPRREAAELAAKLGFTVLNSVGKKLSILIVGDREARFYAGVEKSTKHLRAETLVEAGAEIKILSEKDFLEMVQLT